MSWVCAYCGTTSQAGRRWTRDTVCQHYYPSTPQPSLDPRLGAAAATTPGRVATDLAPTYGRTRPGDTGAAR